MTLGMRALEKTRATAEERSERIVEGPKRWQEFVAEWYGRLVTIGGFWCLIAAIFRGAGWVYFIGEGFNFVAVPVQANLFVGAVLILIGGALRRRLAAAFWIVMAYLVFLLALSIEAIFDWMQDTPDVSLAAENWALVLFTAETACSAIVMIVLVASRRAFSARLAPGSKTGALGILFGGLTLSVLITFALTFVFPRQLTGVDEKIKWSLGKALGISLQVVQRGPHHQGHQWIALLAAIMSIGVLFFAASVFLRTSRARQFMTPLDELHVRRLINEHGEDDSLGYFGTRRDKSVVFSPDGRAAVTYRVVASVSLASADPIGDRESWPAAIAAWKQSARTNGWFPAVLSASEDGAQAYVDAGLKAIEIGDEAIIEAEDFNLDGRAMRQVRQAVTRVQRAGYTLQVRRHHEIPADELAELAELAERWRGGATERGFSMAIGRLGDPTDGRCVMVTTHDADGVVRGMLSFVPWGARGISLDLMRRDRVALNGLNEFMVAGALAAAPGLGVRRMSLNFAMFRSTFSDADRVGAGPVTRLNNAFLSAASKFWQLETLYRSNAKYQPEWLPRYMCYDSSLTMTRTMIASGMAEGFLPAGKVPVQAPIDVEVEYGGALVPFAVAAGKQDDALLHKAPPPRRINEQQRVRRAKVDRLRESGMEAYPVGVRRDTTIEAVRQAHPELGADERTGEVVSLTGRVRALRDFGGVSFAVLEDGGNRIQALLSSDTLDQRLFALWRDTVDIGDHVAITGEVVASRKGELSVLIGEWEMAAKCLRPLPDEHSGFSDPDARVRQRYLDLIVNRESMEVLQARSRAIAAIRASLMGDGFTEVETPMLQAVHGGATARPFRTHINAYNMNLYLRIAPELYLKRLCVGGMSKIFELNRNFRNEGADATHNPEFTSIEAYQAYADYNVMRELTRQVIIAAAIAVHGEPIAVRHRDDGSQYVVRLDGEWPVITVHDAVSAATGRTITSSSTLEEVREACVAHGLHVPREKSVGELVVELYDALVEGQTQEPTFYTDFPVETSPLTRVHRDDPKLSERWDLVAFGAELGTAYSELVDPIDQRERLTAQSLKAAAGDLEAMEIDESFLTALEYAMPPTGGLGIGVDRVVMMLTGGNIRSTLAFPFVRPGTGSQKS